MTTTTMRFTVVFHGAAGAEMMKKGFRSERAAMTCFRRMARTMTTVGQRVAMTETETGAVVAETTRTAGRAA